MLNLKQLIISIIIAMIIWGCSEIETSLKKLDGLNYLSVHDLYDRVHYDKTVELPNNADLIKIINNAKGTIYDILSKSVCSGSEKYLKGVLFSFTPNKTNANIEFPFDEIVDENTNCLEVIKINNFSSSSDNELQFSSIVTTTYNRNISINIELIKEDGRWCLKNFHKE